MPEQLNALVGPFHDTAGVARRLGITEDAVEARRQEHTLLAVPTSDGPWIYPAYQFDGNAVIEALLPAIHALRAVDPWAAGLWFVMADPDLNGVSPLQWVSTGGGHEALASSARRTAHEWRTDPSDEEPA